MFLIRTTTSVSIAGVGDYDPWCDFDDDGDIDIFDIVWIASMYGALGESFDAKAALAYDSGWFDITDKAGQHFNVTHDLNSTNLVVQVWGKTTLDDESHRKHYGGTGSAQALGWIRWFTGPQREEAYSVVQTSNGGYAIAGITSSFGAGNNDFWLIRTNADGNMKWNKTYGGPDGDTAKSLVQTSDGGYAIAGETTVWAGAGAWYPSWWLVKTDADGNMQWNQTFDYAFWCGIATCVVQTSDEGYAIAGSTGFTSTSSTALLCKTNVTGGYEWHSLYLGADEASTAYSMVQTEDDGYALAGSAWSFDEGFRFFLVKANATGWMQWARTYESANHPCAQSLVQTMDGGYVLAGYSAPYGDGDFIVVRTDAFGLIEDFELGLVITDCTVDALTLYRGAIDPYWNYMHVRIWKVKEAP
ncbi:hypothetical protein KAU88_01700 [Candidatus Bathyarchaeota archaeon]|nr:hypothetical protein [Candidatus Bathyarchaeota archaeon]